MSHRRLQGPGHLQGLDQTLQPWSVSGQAGYTATSTQCRTGEKPPTPECLVQRVDQVITLRQDNVKLAYVINTNNIRICQFEGDIYFTFEEILENKVCESLRPHTHSKYFMTKYLST